MDSLSSLIFTLIIGLFLLVGTAIVFVFKNTERIITFSISMALGVMSSLILFELIPVAYSSINEKYTRFWTVTIILISSLAGLFVLRFLDEKIPAHEESKEKDTHYYHIGLVSSIALMLHNVIEGMAIYSSAISGMYLGILVGIGVALHNIPMGMEISSMFYKYFKNKFKTILALVLVSLSTMVGGLIMVVFKKEFLSEFTIGIFLCLNIGMLMYILIFELLPHVVKSKDKRIISIGLCLGLITFIISLLMESFID